jgi:O-Antigen ligase
LKAILILCAALALIAAVVLVGLRLVRATHLWPAALLIVTAPLEVYRTSSSAGLNVSLFRLALALGVVVLAVDLIRGRKRFTGMLAVPFAIYGALVTWQLISLVFVTPAHSLAYRFLGQYAGGLMAAFIITCYVGRKDLRVVAALFGGAAVVPLFAAAFRVFSVRHGGSGDLPVLKDLPLDPAIQAARKSGSYLLDGTQRLNATFSDPNHFGFYIATVFLVSLGATCWILFVKKPVPQRTAASYVLLAISAVVAIIGTYSRSSWLLAGAGVIILGALLGRSVWTRERMIVAGAIGLAVLGLASPLIASRVSTSNRGNVESDQIHERTMSIALKLVAHHPVLGVGLGDYGRHAGQPPLLSSAHSTFLTVTAELGILGVALLLGAIAMTSISAVRSARRAPPGDRAILSGFVAAYVGLAVANILYEVWMDDFQWVLFGLVLALTTQRFVSLRGMSLHRRRASGHGATPATAADQGEMAIC